MDILGLAEHLGIDYGNENCRGHSENAKEGIFRVSSKKKRWCMLLELKNGQKRPKTGNFAEIPRVGFGDFGGNMGRCPPNSMTHIGIPSLGFL